MRKWTNHFVCERSGEVTPMSQLVIEPGTGLRVARKHCDGLYSRNKHPQNEPPPKRREGVPLPIQRPDAHIDETNFIVDELFEPIIDEYGQPMIYDLV